MRLIGTAMGCAFAAVFLGPAMASAQMVPGAMIPGAMMPDRGEAVPACTAPAPLPPVLAAWANPHHPITAARAVAALAKATLTVAQPVDATLPHTPRVEYPVQPAKPGGSVSYGGIFAFDVAEGGSYRVALTSHAWTDVIEDGAALQSIAHGHGPACTGVAKMVDYTLKPGRHILQISAQGDPGISLMIARLP